MPWTSICLKLCLLFKSVGRWSSELGFLLCHCTPWRDWGDRKSVFILIFKKILKICRTLDNLHLWVWRSFTFLLKFAQTLSGLMCSQYFKGSISSLGTLTYYNIYWFHMDPTYWGDPESFRPERFIDPSSNTLLRHERFMPFGHGKRICMGESLAR